MPALPPATVRELRFFAADPFTEAYRDALVGDLAGATWVRFLVCYFSETGYDVLGTSLARAMRHPLSRGLVTLTCACGADAVRRLWKDAGQPLDRVKCFLSVEGDGPSNSDAKLLHSKLVVIRRGPELVVYTGSHNWTGAGLRARGISRDRMNVEAGTRIVTDWDERWLDFVTPSPTVESGNLVVDALNHIERCFGLESCTDLARPGADHELDSWMNAYCKKEVAPPGTTPLIVVNGTLGGKVDGPGAQRGTPKTPHRPLRLPVAGDTLFVQHFVHGNEPEVFDSEAVWALLLWEDAAHLANGGRPWLVLCQPSNLGRQDAGTPSLQTVSWLVYDPKQNSVAGAPAGGGRGTVVPPQQTTVSSGGLRSRTTLHVEHWTVATGATGNDTRALNHRTPDRHVLLTVLAVRRPEREEAYGRTDRPWQGTELPFHTGKTRQAQKRFLVHGRDGEPSYERAHQVRKEQERLFGVRTRADRGPTGEARVVQEDVYACNALINDVLFRVMDTPGIPALSAEPASARRVVFDVDAYTSGHDRTRAVPRMEKLFAPGKAHVMQELGLSLDERRALRWGPK